MNFNELDDTEDTEHTPQERAAAASRSTWVSVVVNLVLSTVQIVVGVWAKSQSLIADGIHSLSDLVADFVVLFANHHSQKDADEDHPYGHQRFETAASLVLGLLLLAVGVGMVWSAVVKLENPESVPQVHSVALWVAGGALVGKELLFRYMLAVAKKVKSSMLVANAWHARSDAASSLVVAAGIGGSLAGYPFLEPLAAAVVGFLILHMGIRLAWKSVRELIDTGLPEEELERLRTTIRETPGVIDLHDMRTRRMADRVLCDAHVQVDPRLTVSEGHRVSDAVYLRVRAAHPEVRDVLVHIDPEDDGELQVVPPGPLPERVEILARMRELLGPAFAEPRRVQIHYLGQRVEVEIILPSAPAAEALEMLQSRRKAWLAEHPHYRNIRVFVETAP